LGLTVWIDELVLRACSEKYFRKIWTPEKPMVVLGSSNQIEHEVHADHCNEDQVEILKRCGGGGTVVLYPDCLILSLGTWVKQPFSNKLYFEKLNAAVLDTLKSYSAVFANAIQSGISDLSIHDKKFSGTSLFRSREFLMYQASIIVTCDFSLIDRYLKHPTKEPDYRRGRKHSDFLVGLNDIDSKTNVARLKEFFEKNFDSFFSRYMEAELTDVNQEHIPHLLKRIERLN